VQHLIRKESTLLKKLLIQRGGYFYISGSSKNMPAAVKSALEEVLEDKQLVESMIKCDKIQEETWS